MVYVGKQRRVGYKRSRDTLFTGSTPVLTTTALNVRERNIDLAYHKNCSLRISKSLVSNVCDSLM